MKQKPKNKFKELQKRRAKKQTRSTRNAWIQETFRKAIADSDRFWERFERKSIGTSMNHDDHYVWVVTYFSKAWRVFLKSDGNWSFNICEARFFQSESAAKAAGRIVTLICPDTLKFSKEQIAEALLAADGASLQVL